MEMLVCCITSTELLTKRLIKFSLKIFHSPFFCLFVCFAVVGEELDLLVGSRHMRGVPTKVAAPCVLQ